jgi:cytochrome c-type biogenesis protein CcmH
MRIRPLLTLLTIAALSLGASAAQAGSGDPPTDDDVNSVAKKLYCPVCPNTPLDVCETKACQDWRAQIRSQLESGWSEDQIINYFVEQYGERVLAEPRMSGFTTLVWLFPLVALIAGLIILRQVLFRWRVSSDSVDLEESDSPKEVPPAMLRRIESELEELR